MATREERIKEIVDIEFRGQVGKYSILLDGAEARILPVL